MTKTATKKCSEHRTDKLGYLEWHSDADKRTKAGQVQKQCPKCLLWLWENQFKTNKK